MRRLRKTPKRIAFALTLLILGSAASFAQRARAEDAKPPTSDAPSLAAYVPAAAGLFIEIDRLPSLIGRQQNRTLWMELLRSGSPDSPWRTLLADAIGGRSENAVLRLFRGQVAAAAPDWLHLSDGILVIANTDAKALRNLVGSDALETAPLLGKVKVVQTRSGLWLATRDGYLVLARERGPGGLFNGAIDLLNGSGTAPLSSRDDFKSRLQNLPGPRDGFAFWSGLEHIEPPAEEGWWPPRTAGALNLLVENQQLSAVLHAATTRTPADPLPPRIVLDRLVKLPQTTLAAYATSLDVRAAFDWIYSLNPPEELRPLWDRIESSLDADKFEAEVVANLGPRCVVFAAANADREDFAPQAGLLIESLDSSAVVDALFGLTERLAATLNEGLPEGRRIRVETADYLDTETLTLTWPRTPDAGAPYTLADLLVEHIRPTVASVDGWLVVATSPELVQQIVDARRGFAPHLGDVVKLSAHAPELRRAVRAAVIQPALAQGALRMWDSLLRARRREAAGRARVAVSFKPDDVPGQVIVADVASNGPSAEKLAPGDGIVACNGVILNLSHADRHLQRILASAAPTSPLRLRVRRGESMFDVEIPPLTEDLQSQPTVLSALLARVAPLERISAQVAVAVYAVERPGRDSYYSRLKLDFVAGARKPSPTPAAEEAAAVPPE
jgi:hypothetical protein